MPNIASYFKVTEITVLLKDTLHFILSPIQTLTVGFRLPLNQPYCINSTGRGLASKLTAGWEFHPAPKES